LTPPRAALFPYTTLFRSPRRQGRTSAAGAVAAAAPQPAEAPNTDRRTDRASEPSATPERRPTGRRATRPSRAQSNVDDAKQQITDRKSTRLNSSHVSISY